MNNVREFGAVGDGVVKDTAAVQRAIDAGGIAYFPPGTYLCGTLYLQSDGGLELAPGAVLLASPDRADYNADDFCPQNRAFASDNVSGAHFIVAVEQHNIVLRGGGRIDGNRRAFYEPYFTRTDIPWRPGQMVYFCECENVSVSDVEMYHAPYWTFFLHGCEQVQIRGVRIYNAPGTWNGDGIDIDCCRFVTVSDCLIESHDDSITLRGFVEPLKKKRACEFVTVSNSILSSRCNAFRIGVGNGVVRACAVTGCIIRDSRNAITICSKYSPERGVLIEDISFDHLYVESKKLMVILINSGQATGDAIAPIRRISISGIRGRASVGSAVKAENPGEISGISISDVRLEFQPDPEIPVRTDGALHAEGCNFAPPAAFHLENIDDIAFERVKLRWNNPGAFRGVTALDCRKVSVSGCDFGQPTEGIPL